MRSAAFLAASRLFLHRGLPQGMIILNI